ncbi:response regulator transcription factor [Rhodoplanes sp. Z2-YC6860]|uniref:response regulator transcription factor n=1 Tax=Rhodoplanes sp. Z2-YC6860 TaxID=674703 RepID=UPI00078DC909|nr:response regulator [Rhodoplanes sp. Z2-YC6860]AMN44570.1 two-component response regulator [Rhodoplanes sp. Z2-YC6860]
MEQVLSKDLQDQIASLKVLIVDDEYYMRKVVRTMLLAIGIKSVIEADNGIAGLEAIKHHRPDIVIVDWEMPLIDGAQFVRMVRSPKDFPAPDVPIIMLSGHGDRWRVVEAARLGAHEYLLKPVSTKALHERIITIVTVPRPFITLDGYYGPAPRKMFSNARPADKAALHGSADLARPTIPAARPPEPATAASGTRDDVFLL